MVDHKLLLEKLHLIVLDQNAVKWVYSYLSKGSQSVCVDGCLSPPLPIECCMPRGSILGPLFYVMFKSDIPDLEHDHQEEYQSQDTFCQDCESTVCYVDDCTYSHGDKDLVVLSSSLSDQYKRISTYMAANKLVINADKTHLVVMGTKATAGRRAKVYLEADGHIIHPSRTERLLGGHISEDLKWREHVLCSDQSLVRQSTSRINGLVKVAQRTSYSTRLMIANGSFVSKLCYLIQLWGGTEGYLLNSLQVLQNREARAVTGLSWFTPTRQLLKQCKWLSVRQLVFYQTVLGTHKIVTAVKPLHLRRKFNINFHYINYH